MGTRTIPAFSQEEKRIMRLDTCKKCIYSECNSSRTNKCELANLICSVDGQKILPKTYDVNQVCPKNYWDYTNKTKVINVSSGCGC